ncbi:MAK10-like protein [Tanacetum coccineum]
MDSFQGLTPKSPTSWHRSLAPILEDLALYDNESWNDPRDFAKPVKAIALPQDVLSKSDRRLIDLENQVQRLLKVHLALTQPTQVNKITTSCEIGSGPHDTQYCMEDLEQAFVEYASSRTNEAREGLVSDFMASKDARLSKFEADFKRQQDMEQEEGNLGNTNSNPQSDPLALITTEQVRKLNSMLESLGLVPQSSIIKFVCSKEDDGEVMFIEIIRDDDEPWNKGPNEGEGSTMEEPAVEYFNTFLTRDELTYHRYLMSGPISSIFLKNPIIMEGCPYNIKIPCNIGHVHIEKAYIDLNSPLNIMTQMMYNWIMRIKLDPRENANGRISNFTGRIKGMHVFIGNFTYVIDFMIVEDISSIIDPRLSQVVLGRPFLEISNMTHDPPEGVVRFIRGADEVAYKMPHKIEQYGSLSNLEKEHTKSVYLRNEEDKRRGVKYGYIKNHKKNVKKNGQAWIRERKSEQKLEAMVKPQSNCSQKVKPWSTEVNP